MCAAVTRHIEVLDTVFDPPYALTVQVRRCEWSIWLEHERRDDQIGEAVWFDAAGADLER